MVATQAGWLAGGQTADVQAPSMPLATGSVLAWMNNLEVLCWKEHFGCSWGGCFAMQEREEVSEELRGFGLGPVR